MDIFDKASELETLHREVAIKAIVKKVNKPSRDDCFDCGETIPKARRDVGGIDRCITCQTILEERA